MPARSQLDVNLMKDKHAREAAMEALDGIGKKEYETAATEEAAPAEAEAEAAPAETARRKRLRLPKQQLASKHKKASRND